MKQRFFRVLACITLCAMGGSLSAASAETYGNMTVDRVLKVYDGATFRANIKGVHPIIGQSIVVKLTHVAVPEIHAQDSDERNKALEGQRFLYKKLYGGKMIVLKNVRRSKYFRLLADVYIDGIDVGGQLINEELGAYHSSSAPPNW